MDTVIRLGAIAGSIIAMASLAAGIWWVTRKLVHIADAVKELLPNGGASLADKVAGIQTDVAALKKQFDEHIKSGAS